MVALMVCEFFKLIYLIILAYMRNPCHVELILTEKEKAVKKPTEKKEKPTGEVKALSA